MPIIEHQEDALIAFRKRDKFSDQSWNERGLNPSSQELSIQLNTFFNQCTDQLMEAVQNNESDSRIKKVLTANLGLLKKNDYDTEEKEFIYSLFEELSNILMIDVSKNLLKWLYGPLLSWMIREKKAAKEETIIETLEQPCIGCGTQLKSLITEKEDGIPLTEWMIVKCNNCGEFNLLTLVPGIKGFKFDNYQWVENLFKDDYSYESASVRLEQIKLDRKK